MNASAPPLQCTLAVLPGLAVTLAFSLRGTSFQSGFCDAGSMTPSFRLAHGSHLLMLLPLTHVASAPFCCRMKTPSAAGMKTPPKITHKIAQINPYESMWVLKVKVTAKYPVNSFHPRGSGATQKVFNVDLIDDEVR